MYKYIEYYLYIDVIQSLTLCVYVLYMSIYTIYML